MKASLQLEFPGADCYQYFNGIRRLYNGALPGFGNYVVGDKNPITKPWAAEITGRDNNFKFSRVFIKPHWDYSRANSKGSRGVYLFFILESGRIYEVQEKYTRRTRRYFCTVNQKGIIHELSQEELELCLKYL